MLEGLTDQHRSGPKRLIIPLSQAYSSNTRPYYGRSTRLDTPDLPSKNEVNAVLLGMAGMQAAKLIEHDDQAMLASQPGGHDAQQLRRCLARASAGECARKHGLIKWVINGARPSSKCWRACS